MSGRGTSKEARPGAGASAGDGAFNSGEGVLLGGSGVRDGGVTWERFSKCDSRKETGFCAGI